MKGKFICHIVLVIVGLSATTAMAQTESSYYTILDLISDSIASRNDKNRLSVIEILSSKIDSKQKAGSNAPIERIATHAEEQPEIILASIINAISAHRSSEGATPEGTLQYLANLYGSHDYYETGGWDDPKADFSFPRNITLPQYDMTDFYRPVWGRITSPYGYRPSFGRIHKGIDLALNEGDTVRAALPGVVSRVGFDAGGYGNFVIIRHDNDVETRYGHLQISLATPGQTVMAGQSIALGGNTGNSTGPHLHFETRYMGSAVDPSSLFDFTGRSMNIYARQVKPNYRPGEVATGFNAERKPIVSKSTYVVRVGDTIEKIAKRSGISVLKLCQLNFIAEDTPLEPGRMIKLK